MLLLIYTEMCDGARWCFLPIIWFLIYALSFFKDHKKCLCAFHAVPISSSFICDDMLLGRDPTLNNIQFENNSRRTLKVIQGGFWSQSHFSAIYYEFLLKRWDSDEKKSLFKFYGPGALRDHTIWLLSQILFYKEYLCYHVRYLCIIAI